MRPGRRDAYDEVLRTRIFEPLGMRDTGFSTADVERWRRRTSRPRTGSWSGTSRTASGAGRPAFYDGAAGLVSTVDDLLAFARMLLRGGDPVLTADQVREMSRDHLTAEQRASVRRSWAGGGWGLGSAVRGAVGLRLGRWTRHIVPRAPGARPRRDRLDPAAVRVAHATRRAPRDPRRRIPRPGLRPLVRRHAYGPDPAQFGELVRPTGPARATTVVVLHGGFWRARYDLALGRPLAERPSPPRVRRCGTWSTAGRGRGGWPAAFVDVAAGWTELAVLDVDLGSVVALGHSAGGRLATWAAARISYRQARPVPGRPSR